MLSINGKSVMIYTEGGTFGLGHVIRCIHLARALVHAGMSVEFTTPINEPIGAERLRKEGYIVHNSFPMADMVLVDVEQYPGLEFMEMLRGQYHRVVLIGGVSYPAARELETLVDLTVYQGELFDCPAIDRALNGPEYLIINPAFADCVPCYDGSIVVSMGGRDPYSLTPTAARMLGMGRREVIVIAGPAADYEHDSRSIRFVKSPPSLVPYLNGASLAIVTTGMTAYEALAAGVPCVLTNISADHNRTAEHLEKLGVAVNVGLWPDFSVENIRPAVRQAFVNWRAMSDAGQAMIDGKGATRVAEAICLIMA